MNLPEGLFVNKRVKYQAMANAQSKNPQFEFFRKRPDGDIDPAGEAGWFLQRQREESRISLEEASRSTNIHTFHLKAIEEGDLTGLPQRDDALAMIAAYANFLGFDPKPLVLHFAKFLPKQPMPGHRQTGAGNKQPTERPAPLSSAKILRFPIMARLRSMSTGAGGVVASSLGAILIFATASWMFIGGSENDSIGKMIGKTEQVASVNTVSEMPMPDTARATDKIASAADRSANGLSGLGKLISESADTTITTASIPKPGARPGKVKKVGVSKADKTGGRIYGNENRKSRLTLKASATVWVRIEDAKGNVVMTRTLMKGDSYRVPARNGLVVISRDGGLLTFAVDGKSGGKLGHKGEILVGRSLDIKDLKRKNS